MPKIISSAELRNNYNGISKLCHTNNEPVFITKNGKGDLAILSIEAYDQLISRLELYHNLYTGMQDIQNNNTSILTESLDRIRSERKI